MKRPTKSVFYQDCSPVGRKAIEEDELSHGSNMTDILSNCLLIGKSDGRQIETLDGWKVQTLKIFERPNLISMDEDISSYLTKGINEKYFYRYSLECKLTKENQKKLAAKLKQDFNITDHYEELQSQKSILVPQIVHNCKPEIQKIIEQFQETIREVKSQQSKDNAEIKSGIADLKRTVSHHETHSIVLIGDTGAGKSTIASWLSNDFSNEIFKVSHDEDVTTNHVHQKEVRLFKGTEHESLLNTTLQILDSPGLGNTAMDKDGIRLTDEHVLNIICDTVQRNCPYEYHELSTKVLLIRGSQLSKTKS